MKNSIKKDLEYFREFLEHPETFRHADFYDWVNKWGNYIKAHKKDFNYLRGDEWKEIRERLIIEVRKRDAIDPKLLKEYNQICKDIQSIKFGVFDERFIEILRRFAEFTKKYAEEFRFSEQDIFDAEEDLRLSLIDYETQKAEREKHKSYEQKLLRALKNPGDNEDKLRLVRVKAKKPASGN
jgi:hypothetical protein